MTNKKLNLDERIIQMRKASGDVTVDSKLVSFLYELMRDYITPGDVELIVQSSEEFSDVTYTNGWLAKYAEYLAQRLVGAQSGKSAEVIRPKSWGE